MLVPRRSFLSGLAGALLLPPSLLGAAKERDARDARYRKIYQRIDADLGQSVARIQRWIRQPSVSTQNLGMQECCQLTQELLREAGFQQVEKLPTERPPGILATLDVGAPRPLGVYFMYDVQPVVPAEWS